MEGLHGPELTIGENGCYAGKPREERDCVVMRSAGTLGIEQVVVSCQCQAEEFQSDPLVPGEVPLVQWRRDILERLVLAE